MPSPLGHSLAGLCGYMLARSRAVPLRQPWLFVGAVLIANLPDLDLLPAFLFGGFSSLHRQWTHSLAAAVVFALLSGAVAKRVRSSGILWGVWGGAVYSSHIVLDMLLDDPSFPRGVQLFWPFSESYFIFSFTPFASFRYGRNLGIVTMFFEPHNVATMIRETVLMTPWVILAAYLGGWFWKRR
jgi:inner membrane protein